MASRRRGVGRPGALDEAKALVTLVSSLSETGDSLDPEAVAQRMGTDMGQAEKLVSLILSSTLLGDVGLPLVEESGGVTLVESGGVRGRRLRLTRDETLALVAALERMGVGENDPLRRSLELSLSAEPVSEELVLRLMAGEEGQSELAQALSTIGRALAHGLALDFSYHKPGASAERRHVVCLGLRCDDDTWFLDAHDLERNGERTFRVDRMSAVSCGERERVPEPARDDTGRTVSLTFSDPRYLALLPWHDLRITARSSGRTEAETPYYGGTWLVRMLAACGDSVVIHDEELALLVRDYARRALEDDDGASHSCEALQSPM